MRSLSRSVAGSQVGAGGEQKLVVGRVKNVQLGPFTIDSPILSLSQDTQGFGASEESDGILGGEVLRRFKVILDYSRQRLILEPNSDLNQPYEIGMTGFSFGSKEEDCKVQRIESIEPHSPASDAGLQLGDIITAIDGRAVSDIPSNEL
ncbi:MAG TPA: PDZ domain-containing protein, partial [Pyrinomonadaceae bacterium]